MKAGIVDLLGCIRGRRWLAWARSVWSEKCRRRGLPTGASRIGWLRGAALAATLCSAVVAPAYAHAPCTDSAERFVRVGQTVTMCIPRSWIDYVAGSEADGALLLFALWPSLDGFYNGQEKTRPISGLDYGGRVQVLLHLSDRLNPLQERYENMLRLYSPHSRHASIMGLEHWGRDESPTSLSQTKVEIYFVEDDNGQIQSYIECDLPGTHAAPGCAEEIYIDSFLVRISYSRVLLSDWQNIETNIRSKVHSFIR